MSEKHFVGLDVTSFEDNGKMLPVSRVTLNVDDDTVLTAGDDTGYEIVADCPHATQSMVNALLSQFKGYRYQMFTADSANLDPAAELGDGITVGNVYSVISRLDDDGSGYSGVSAPGEAELEEEFPTEGPITRAFNKKISDTRATITKTASEIRFEVTQGDNANKSLIEQTATSIRQEISAGESGSKSLIEQTAAAIRQEVLSGDSANKSLIDQNAAQIQLRVEKSGVISAINQSAEKITINAGKISLEGLVTVNKTFQIDSQGYLKCTGGTIGGFTIGTSSIYNGMSTFSSTDNGVYIGTNGIALGGGDFSVSSSGYLTAKQGSFTGAVNATSGTFSGTVYASYGSFDSVSISGSTITSSSFSGTAGSITGGTFTTPSITGGSFSSPSLTGTIGGSGTYSSPTISGGTLSSRTGGTYVGTCSGSSLSSCNLAGTTLGLTSGSSAYLNVDGNVAYLAGNNVRLQTGSSYFLVTNSYSVAGGNLESRGDLKIDGSKNRKIATSHFGNRLFEAYESTTPIFGDYGTGVMDENGVCYIIIDPIFAESVNDYFVPLMFITAYGEGTAWVEEVSHDVVKVCGTPGIRFAWNTVYQQANSYQARIREDAPPIEKDAHDYPGEARVDFEFSAQDYAINGIEDFAEYNASRINYGLTGCDYYENFERSLVA